MTDATLPADDLKRQLVIVDPDDPNVPHLGLAGDTYTVLLSGKNTAGLLCLIDMHVPPGGGPPPHRHDFEETFILLNGELEAIFRGDKRIVRAGGNDPHPSKCSSSIP